MQRGSEQSVQIAREDVSGRLADLERFAYSSAEGRDHGVNVRHRYDLPALRLPKRSGIAEQLSYLVESHNEQSS